MEIKDKTALVTGSARGLGFAMIQELADRGAKCVVTDIDEAGVAEAVKKLQATGARARGIVCDVSDETSVENLFRDVMEKEGCPDIAVLNAGILRDGLLIRMDRETGKLKSKMSLKDWQDVIDVNLTGIFLTGREAAACMAERGQGGVIIPISSISRVGFAGQSNYSAAKAGVASLTALWAQELARYKIRVAGIAPGFIATEMVLNAMNQKAREAWEAKIPIGRLGNPDEIARTATFIVENDLVNGVVVEAHGGVRA